MKTANKHTKLTRECYTTGLKTIFNKNYGVPTDAIDYTSEIDYVLSYYENYTLLFHKLKRRGYINI